MIIMFILMLLTVFGHNKLHTFSSIFHNSCSLQCSLFFPFSSIFHNSCSLQYSLFFPFSSIFHNSCSLQCSLFFHFSSFFHNLSLPIRKEKQLNKKGLNKFLNMFLSLQFLQYLLCTSYLYHYILHINIIKLILISSYFMLIFFIPHINIMIIDFIFIFILELQIFRKNQTSKLPLDSCLYKLQSM